MIYIPNNANPDTSLAKAGFADKQTVRIQNSLAIIIQTSTFPIKAASDRYWCSRAAYPNSFFTSDSFKDAPASSMTISMSKLRPGLLKLELKLSDALILFTVRGF